jgi:hypothetical protein
MLSTHQHIYLFICPPHLSILLNTQPPPRGGGYKALSYITSPCLYNGPVKVRKGYLIVRLKSKDKKVNGHIHVVHPEQI